MKSENTLLTPNDIYSFAWLEDPRISPDGQTIAYIHVRVDRVHNCYRRAIYTVAVHSGTPRRLSIGNKQDTMPRWSPNGRRLAFVSTRDDEKGQIYIINVDGGEAQQLTRLPSGASAPAWSPDGTRIAFLAQSNETERAAEDTGTFTLRADSAWEEQRLQEQREQEEQERNDPRVITRLPYRTNMAFLDDRRRHIYIVDVPDDDIEDLPQPQRITDGDIHYSEPTWMPDGQSLLTTATRDPEADSIFAFYDVLRIPATGGKPEVLTESGYSSFTPYPSPDGTMIAFRRMPEDRLLASGYRIAVIPAEGGEPRTLTAHTKLNIETFRWHPDGHCILFTAGWQGDTRIHTITLEPDAAKRRREEVVTGNRIVESFDVGGDGTIAFIAGSPHNPCELFVRTVDGTETQLTQINAPLLDTRKIAPFEELYYTAPDGEDIQGWVLHPPDFDPAQQYPLAVYIHGGPFVMWGPGFRTMWHEWQVCAARGYVVFFCNPRGSDGYGQVWRDAIRRHWGESDAPDILSGIDTLLQRGYIDPERIAVTGGSYGGFMTAWLISHSERFACAVASRGVFNLITEHSTSDAHELIESEFDGYPWDLHEELWYYSPLAHVHKINTPLLLLHGELDYRTPISEAEQLFALLRRQKKPVELVRYLREGHEITRIGEPHHRVDHMTRTLNWFDRYCKME